MTYTTIKIPVDAHKLIASLALKSNQTKQDVLIHSLKEYETKIFWENCRSRYEEVAKDKDQNLDSNLYENTLSDGLEDEY